MTTWAAVRKRIQRIAPHLIPVISTLSASGNVAYLVDTTMWTDTGTDGDYLKAKTGVGAYIFRPSAVTTERERRIGGTTGPIDLSNGRVYHGGPVWTGAPSNGDSYEIHKLQPTLLWQMFNDVLDELLVAVAQPVPMFDDADLTASGVASWTASNLTGGSSIKTTTAAKVLAGPQSLRVLLSGSGGYYETATAIDVVPGQQYTVMVPVQVATGGPFFVRSVVASSGATIATSSSTSSLRYTTILHRFTPPDGCYQVKLRLVGTANLDDAYMGQWAGPRYAGDAAPIFMPSWLTRDANLIKLMNARYLQGVGGDLWDSYSRVFDAPYVKGRDYQLRISPQAAHPYTLEWRTQPADGELWMEALRPASDVYAPANTAAGESTVVNLDEMMLALMVARKACVAILNDNPQDTEAAHTLAYIDGPVKGKPGPLPVLLKEYERDLVTVPQQPVVMSTYRAGY